MKYLGLFTLILLTTNCNTHLENTTDSQSEEQVFLKAFDQELQLNNTDTHTISIGDFGDEEGAAILQHPSQFEQSEIVRDASSNWNPVYKYKAKNNFKGVDSVLIETCKLNKQSPSLNCSKDTLKIKLTIDK